MASESPNLTGGSLPLRLDLEDGDVGLGVAADDLGLEPGVVVQDDRDLVGVLDDVVVGDDVAVVVDEEARPQRGGAPPRLLLLLARLVALHELLEELLERRTGRQLRQLDARVAFDRLGRRDVDDRRQQPRGEIGEAVGRGAGERRVRHSAPGNSATAMTASSIRQATCNDPATPPGSTRLRSGWPGSGRPCLRSATPADDARPSGRCSADEPIALLSCAGRKHCPPPSVTEQSPHRRSARSPAAPSPSRTSAEEQAP